VYPNDDQTFNYGSYARYCIKHGKRTPTLSLMLDKNVGHMSDSRRKALLKIMAAIHRRLSCSLFAYVKVSVAITLGSAFKIFKS
jgi:hypothetical protein